LQNSKNQKLSVEGCFFFFSFFGESDKSVKKKQVSRTQLGTFLFFFFPLPYFLFSFVMAPVLLYCVGVLNSAASASKCGQSYSQKVVRTLLWNPGENGLLHGPFFAGKGFPHCRSRSFPNPRSEFLRSDTGHWISFKKSFQSCMVQSVGGEERSLLWV